MDYEKVNTPMGPNGPRLELIYHDDMDYEGWINPRFIVHKNVLEIMQGCIGVSE